MATKTKTIEFVADTVVGALTSATDRDENITIYIPEGDPVFTSCSLWCNVSADTTGQLDDPVLGISDDGITFTEYTMGDQPSSGEVNNYQLRADVTSYFTANFDGATPPTSDTWTVRFRAPSDTTNNHSFKLILTYDYDDTETTQIKTVRIPIESTLATLTTDYQDLGGTTSIPAVEGSYMPEASKTVRQVWLELFGPSGSDANLNLDVRVDSTTEYRWQETVSATSDFNIYTYGLIDITAEDLSTAVKLEAKSSVTSTVPNLGGYVCVTYEFNASTSTSILNSVILPVPIDSVGMTTTKSSTGTVRINIQEPTPALVESAVVGRTPYDDVIINLGSQTTTEFTMVADSSYAGDYTFVHRFDANAAKSAGFTLARGDNNLDVTLSPDDTTGANDYPSFNGFMVLNYTSGKHAQGVGAHNHSIYTHLKDSTGDPSTPFQASGAAIGEADFYLNAVIGDLVWVNYETTGVPLVSMQPEKGSGSTPAEDAIDEYVRDVSYVVLSPPWNEAQTKYLALDYTRFFKRHPGEVGDQLMDVTATRNWQMRYRGIITTPVDPFGLWTTYHTCTYAWDLAVVNYTGDGSGISYYVYNVDTEELLDQGTTATGGTASGVAYDDTVNYRAHAIQGLTAGASLEVTL